MKRILLSVLLAVTLALAAGPLAFFDAADSAEAQGGAVWTAQFYSNRYLLGDPAYTTTYGNLSLNWGANAPGPNVPADNWSARFSTDVYFPAGTYRFYIQADDAIQLWIDFPPSKQPQFSTFNDPKPGQLLTYDYTLEAGSHHIQIDFREASGLSYIFFDWQNLADTSVGPNFPTVVNPEGPWMAQYFNNAALAGTPVSTRDENSPTHNWGDGAPLPGMPADYFSVRWARVQTFDPGTYRVVVESDDGVRVFVDNQRIIDEWHTASGQSYSGVFTSTGQQQTFTIEYYEAAGLAYLDYEVERVTGGQTQQPSTGTTATILAYRLNVRTAPNVETGRIIAKVSRGEVYPIIGRNMEGTWFLIRVNGTDGWVSGRYIAINNEQPLPIVDGTAPQQPPAGTGYSLSTWVNLNIRQGPSVSYDVVEVLPYGETATVLGRNADASWWQVRYNGVIGWVSAYYTTITPEPNLDAIPITG